jgi:hypothetical protein
MSHIFLTSMSSDSSFEAALEAYKRVTGKTLVGNLFATRLQACRYPSDLLATLQSNVKERLTDGERLSKWLKPTR